MPKNQNILIFIASIFAINLNAQFLFEEVSSSNGLSFEYQESLKMGGGAAAFDFDNDGDDDLFIVGGQNPDGLFENDGNGNFTDVSLTTNISLLTNSVMSTSVVTGDIDNDGFREIFIGTIGENGTSFEAIKPNLLLKYNPVTSTYENIIESAEISDLSFCMGAHLFDSNLDGYLDLYLINYVSEPKTIQDGSQIIGFDHECYKNKLYINNGDGTFSDQTSTYGLDQSACSLAATSSDLDWDGDPDLIVANDFGKWLEPNQLFQNEGENSPYSNISQSSNTNAQMYGMGIAVGDYDEDLDMDFYITNIGDNFFFENSGNMSFIDIAQEKGLRNSITENGLNTTGWGAIFEDFNNDSYLDLFVSNGYVYSAVDIDDTEQYDELYLGSSDFTFNKATPDCGINFYGPSRGALKGDWNLDGHLDLVTITNEKLFPEIQNSINFYTNASSDNNWIGFDLTGTSSNRDAYGTKVILHAEERTLMRELRGGDSHASQGSSKLHIGLGDITTIDSVKIYWPSGIIETLSDLDINTYHNISEGTNTIITENDQILSEISIYPNPSNNYLNIELKNINQFPILLKLFDPNGKLVLEKNIKHNKLKIDISDLNSGLYRLIAFYEKKSASKNISIINP